MAAPLYTGRTESGRLYHAGQILISTVGLPARGKTHSGKALERYLTWLGVKVRVFSLGDYRRSVLGTKIALPDDYFSRSHRSEATAKLRQSILDGMEQIIEEWFQKENGQVAIYDANNGTIKLRERLRNRFQPLGVHMFFLESVCDRESIIEANIRAVKLNSPDYKGWDPDEAVKDYWKRIKDHELTYETIEQPSFPYVKIINVGERIVVNNIQGYLQSRIVFFLMNVHNKPRTIWLARSGRSKVEHSYRADASLSTEGVAYAEALRSFIVSERRKAFYLQKESEPGKKVKPLTVWTSSRNRCRGTCQPFLEVGFRVQQFTQMSEINPGVIDGMTPEEIQKTYPEEYARAQKDPFAHRYPRAESYHDLSVRLEPVIFNLERHQGDLLIIGHASVLRCLFSYLKGLSPQDIPAIDIQRGDAIQITPTAYGMISKTHHFALDPSQQHIGSQAYIYGSPSNLRVIDYPPPLSVETVRQTLQESNLDEDN